MSSISYLCQRLLRSVHLNVNSDVKLSPWTFGRNDRRRARAVVFTYKLTCMIVPSVSTLSSRPSGNRFLTVWSAKVISLRPSGKCFSGEEYNEMQCMMHISVIITILGSVTNVQFSGDRFSLNYQKLEM